MTKEGERERLVDPLRSRNLRVPLSGVSQCKLVEIPMKITTSSTVLLTNSARAAGIMAALANPRNKRFDKKHAVLSILATSENGRYSAIPVSCFWHTTAPTYDRT
jgi:hypothetical protein